MIARRWTLNLLLMLCLTGTGRQARAADIRTWSIEATVVSVDDPQGLFGDVRLGDTVRGDFAYDIAMTPTFPGDTWDDYDHPVGFEGIRLAIENPRTGGELRYLPKHDTSYLVSVFTDHYIFPGDDDSAVDFWQSATPPVPGVLDLVYIDFSGPGVLTETTLPTEYHLDDWESAAIYLSSDEIVAVIHTITPIAAGDFDLSGSVDDADYGVWASEFGSTGVVAADGDRDGRVGGADFLIWQANLGAVAAATISVPEPVSVVLLWGLVVTLPTFRLPHAGLLR